MRMNLILIFVICLYVFSNAQTNDYQFQISELKQKLEQEEKNALKIEIYNEILEIGKTYDSNLLWQYSSELLEFSEKNGLMEGRALACFYLGDYYYNKDIFDSARIYYNQSLEIYEHINNRNRTAEINYFLGLTNQYLNNYNEALAYYQKSVEIYELLGNQEKVAISYHDIGTLYSDLKKLSLALYYYNKALDIYKETDNKERIAAINQNIGVLHYNWGNYDQALDYYKQSLNTFEQLNDKQNIAISLSNIGLVYENNKQYYHALEYYQKALIFFEEIGYKPTLVYIFYNLGSAYKNIKNYSKSAEYYNKSLKIAYETQMKDYISYNYEAMSALYEHYGEYKKALDFYKQYISVKDSIFNEEKLKEIENLESKFQIAKHQKEIEFLKLDQRLKESQLEKKEAQNLILIFSSFLAFIIAVILFLFNRSNRKYSNKLQNEIEERSKTEIQLLEMKNELEIRVKERTLELELANQNLRKEIEEHKKTMVDLEKEKLRAEESDRLKSNFLANISHELRTPMNAITGFAQMLAFEHLSNEKKLNYINHLQEGCRNLTGLVDDIIDFAIIDSGEAQIEKKSFNPHPTLEFLLDHYTNEIIKRNRNELTISYSNINKENDIQINTDPARFKQILSILIDNAIKFTERGQISFGFIHPDTHRIQFFVKDTGIGIDEQYRDIVFERFRQVDESINKKYGGSGIGLSVAKNLAMLLNGKLWFESTPGKGTTFYFEIPFESTEKEFNVILNQKLNWSDKTILVAEDKKINFEIIKETLSETGAEVLWAKNGQEAIDFISNNHKIDLILMDIQMPVVNGYEATKEIKKINNLIPIIAQTAYAMPQDSVKCIDAGCDDYISKPISLDQFIIKISRFLD